MSRQLGHLKRKRNIARRQQRYVVERIDATQALVKDMKVPLEIPDGLPKGQLRRVLTYPCSKCGAISCTKPEHRLDYP